MRWSTGIEIDQADDRNAGGIKAEDIRRGERFCPFDSRRQAVRRRELGQHDRGRLIDETAPRHAEDGMFTLPFRRQGFLAENGQMFHSLHFQQRFPPQTMLLHRWLN